MTGAPLVPPDHDLVQPIHRIVAGHAVRQPEAVALRWPGGQLSYRELDRAADHLAAELAERGVGPGHRVPVLMSRSADLVSTLLAVLKRGAAYAAFDVSWPAARRDQLIGVLDPPLVVADHRPDPACPAPVWVPSTAELRPDPAGARHAPVAQVGADSLCAVFFTSGTTGAPKGVLSPHRGTVRLFRPCGFAEFGPGTVMPQAAPLPWDGLSLELWSVLLTGGTCVLVDGPYLSPAGLRELVGRDGVDTVWLTSSLFTVFVEEDLDAFGGLRQVLTGGEAVSAPHARRFLQRHPAIRLVNGYGPAESTIFATTHRVTPEDCDRPAGVPIGTPVPGTEVFVLDGDRQCRDGEVGELCIAGTGLAQGYLADARLTAERFVELPFGHAVRRLYRTGDLGHRSDGLLHFVGRADRQLKVRGHRVEPAGVERVVDGLLGVAGCAVLSSRDPLSGEIRLVLCYRTAAVEGPDEAAVRAELNRLLPAYSRPDLVHRLPGFPLTAHGKLDRARLADLVAERFLDLPRLAATEVAAQLPTETPAAEVAGTEVAAEVAAVLGRATVPVEASLLDLGASSLAATRLAIRLGRRFGLSLPVSVVLAQPSARALAGWLTAARVAARADRERPGGQTSVRAGRPEPASPVVPEVPLIPPQAGFLLAYEADRTELASLCLVGWWVEGRLDETALAAALAEVTHRHEALRAEYLLADEPVAVVRPSAGAAVLTRSIQAADDAAASRAARAELSRPLAIDRGEVWRACTAHSAASGRTLLALAVHHIALDGRAEHVLSADLAAAYRAQRHGRAPAAGPAAPSLAEIAGAYRDQLAAADLGAQRRYWRQVLPGTPDLAVPRDPGSPAGRVAALSSTRSNEPAEWPDQLTFRVPAAVISRWAALARRHRTTRFVVLFAGFVRAVRDAFSQRDLGIGVPVSQRSSALLYSAVSCLINTVCIRTGGVEGADLGTLVAATRAAVQAALAAQDVPVAEVVRLVDPPRTDRQPLFQLVFAVQDAPPAGLSVGRARANRLWRPAPARAMVELATEVWPAPGGHADIVVTHQPDRVPAAVAAELAARYRQLLSGLVEADRGEAYRADQPEAGRRR